MNDLITIVVPVYKVEQYLKKCVDSIINQTYKNLEIILVDDGSPDNCGNMCDEYANLDSRVKVIHKENGGLSSARNAGIEIAKGKYISFVDSDDYITNDYIEFLYNLILTNNVKVSICSHTVIYDTGLVLEKATNEHSVIDTKTAIERILYDEGLDTSAWAKLYETKLFENIKYPNGKLFEDSATTCKILCECDKVAIGSKSKYFYLIRNNSITKTNFSSNKMDLITSTKDMGEYVLNKYPDLKKAVNRRIMYAYLSTLSQLANSKEKHLEEQKELLDYIKKYRKEVLADKRIKKRDRLALHCLAFGFNFYKLMWKIYKKVSNRE
ncbi:MAG: glycosyltransferase family 2 protein [Clostridia bacterium]|nr:glycosyltransferase family 2 protein [Clostridia bacterium]